MEQARKILKDTFGHENFRGEQERVQLLLRGELLHLIES